jgi:hypothetical protein
MLRRSGKRHDAPCTSADKAHLTFAHGIGNKSERDVLLAGVDRPRLCNQGGSYAANEAIPLPAIKAGRRRRPSPAR